jgi:NADH dehydrogenase
MGNERIRAKTVVWTAGVAPSPAGKWLGTAVDRAGRVRIEPDLTVPEHPDIFVIGDTASLDQDGHPLPGVAQVAMQQGKYAAASIVHRGSPDSHLCLRFAILTKAISPSWGRISRFCKVQEFS